VLSVHSFRFRAEPAELDPYPVRLSIALVLDGRERLLTKKEAGLARPTDSHRGRGSVGSQLVPLGESQTVYGHLRQIVEH
jgi:hypothetical protein